MLVVRRVVERRGEGRTDSERRVEDEDDDSVRKLELVTRVYGRRWKEKTYGVTSSWFPARNGSRMHRSGTFCLFNDSPI